MSCVCKYVGSGCAHGCDLRGGTARIGEELEGTGERMAIGAADMSNIDRPQ
jgi:hypothetical protein